MVSGHGRRVCLDPVSLVSLLMALPLDQQQQLVHQKGYQQWNQGDRVQAGLVPATTDLRWPAGLQVVQIYSTFHPTEATSELCLPPVSYQRLSAILDLGHQRNQTD